MIAQVEWVSYPHPTGTKRFRVTIEKNQFSESSFTAQVDEVTAWTDGPAVATPVEFRPYLKCFIKWDGCSHLTFEDDQIHLCGVEDFKLHLQLIHSVWAMAFQAMGRPVKALS